MSFWLLHLIMQIVYNRVKLNKKVVCKAMSNKLNIDFSRALDMPELEKLWPQVEIAHKMLHHDIPAAGSDFTGWVNWPTNYDKAEYSDVQAATKEIKDNSDVLVVIGIGGSYLGARTVIEALTTSFHDLLPAEKRGAPQVIFAGQTLSSTYLKDLVSYLDNKDFSINVISKSGTTTEPAIAFRALKAALVKKYGNIDAYKRIYVTTDKEKGSLIQESRQNGYKTFTVPDDIGGRYSVFTAVGLLPIAVAGIDIDTLMNGANAAMQDFDNTNMDTNICYQYAAVRNALYNKGKDVEILASYEPCLQYLGEWFKQLYGESEGKDHKGIFPASCSFTTDLHSMGQYIQQGKRNLFETVLRIDTPTRDLTVEHEPADLDGFNFLAGSSIDEINKKALAGTLLAHQDGGVPNIVINLPALDAYNLGYLLYFFEKACAISGYMLGVNPFDQPGVEAYKKNMFALLGKKGFEDLREELLKRI